MIVEDSVMIVACYYHIMEVLIQGTRTIMQKNVKEGRNEKIRKKF